MKHIATTNTGEVIVALKMSEINELMMLANSASVWYAKQIKASIDPERRKIQEKRADKWWRELYDLRETIK